MGKRKRPTKYLYLFVLQGNYGHGWEDLTASEELREMRSERRAYRVNDSYDGSFRIIKRRELRAAGQDV
jgi:hypothetical protein